MIPAMASWTEGRGYTLILTHPRGPDRYARVVLVHKRTLFGPAFNVREARAEDAARSGREPASLGLGRMLSWRWLGEREAEELLAARLRTLETLGYSVFGAETIKRGPWDWLRDLVNRQLHRGGVDGDASQPADNATQKPEHDSQQAASNLRESLAQLGLEPHTVIEGLSTILEIEQDKLREPTTEVLGAIEPELLALLLPVFIEHDAEALREVGRRWLALAATPYEIEAAVLERWVGGEGALALALAPRLEREGLALLGPEALARLSHTAAQPRVKSIAARWHARLVH
jgi:hypothetical protein